MVYLHDNTYKSGKAIKEAFKNGVELTVFQPGPFGPDVKDGSHVIEGPHYPEAHRFYVSVEVENGKVVKVKK